MWQQKLVLAGIVALSLSGCGVGNNRHQIRYEEYPWTKPYCVWIHTQERPSPTQRLTPSVLTFHLQ